MFKSIFLAFLFVLPLYWVWLFELVLQTPIPLIINSIFGLLSLYVFLFIPSKLKFKFGFFVALFWFYWVGFSFVYFGFGYLVPLISIIVACIYMLLFAIALWFESPLYRIASLLILSFIHPFDFDWMVIDSFLAYSYFGISKSEIFTLLIAITLFHLAIKTSSKVQKSTMTGIALALLSLSIELPSPSKLPPLKIDLLHTNFSQDFKWQRENSHKNTTSQMQMIYQSIQAGNQLIVLPETAFPFILQESAYFQIFKDLSKQATLIIGSLQQKESNLYNSTYVFQNGEVKIFDKVVLAPFGEKIPLPDFLAKPLMRVFLGDGAPQFSASEEFGSFEIEGMKFKSVICYEGTSALTYQDSPRYLVVISNNAWFPHTIEPALQKNLMKYYARLHKSTIFHSSNGSPSFVIFP